MATVSDLKDALKSLLARNGALDRIEAQAKFEVFAALDKRAPLQNVPSHLQIDEATFVINELILEYMKFNDLRFSESVFRSEMQHKHEPMSRRLLCQSLNVKPTVSAKVSMDDVKPESGAGVIPFAEKPVPLLYYFVEHFKSIKSQGN